MDNFEELKREVSDFFEMIINLWKTERVITDTNYVCTYFPYINFMEFTFPIYKLVDSKLFLVEWDTYSFIDNTLIKSDFEFDDYIQNPYFDFSFDNNPELLTAFVKSLTSIRKVKELIKNNSEYSDELNALKDLQQEYVKALGESTFTTVKIYGDSIIKPDSAIQTVEKVEDFEVPEDDMWVVIKSEPTKDD